MNLLLKLCSIVFVLNLLLPRVCHCQLLFSSNVDPDFSRTPCELIESRKFICEEHFVTTDDGYILALHHIINPVYKRLGKKLIKPMVLQHGLLGSSTHFLTNSNGGFAADWTNETVSVDLTVEGRNLAFLLANIGYDVWMPNSRGNKYSKNHTTLDPNQDSSFWQISFDEMISYDCPAVIDYVLSRTGFDHLGWIGHSQGSLIMFGMLAERPEYTDKVKPFVALAPIAHVEHIKSPIRYITLIPGAMRLVKTLGGELSLPSFLLDILSEKVCGRRIVRQVCGSALFLLCGYDPDQFNYTRTPVYYSHAMGGTSAWNLLHFGQNILNRNFLKFDYGFFGNIFRYGSLYPPAYNLEAIQSENIVLIRSNNDPFADSQDVQILKASLKHPHIDFLVQDQKFNHLDFIWAKNVYEQVYGPMLGILERFN